MPRLPSIVYITKVRSLKNIRKYNPCPLYSDVWTLRILYALLLKCKYNFGITENETQIQPYLLQYLLHSIRQPIFIQVWEKKSHHWEKWIVLRKKKNIYIYIAHSQGIINIKSDYITSLAVFLIFQILPLVWKRVKILQ